MRAFARSAVVVLAVAALGGSAPASAGGAVFNFRRAYYVPSETAVGSETFGKGSVGLHMLDRGPFYAYLIPAGRWIDPPRIPAGPLPLGPMRIVPFGELCGGPCYRATVRFTVPEVPSGHYGVGYCNDPCTVAGVGELTGGSITVYQSHEEARIERLRQRVDAVRTNHRTFIRRVEARRHELEIALTGAREVNASLSDRIEALRGELATRAREAERFQVVPALGWILLGLTWIGIVFLFLRRRARLQRRSTSSSAPRSRAGSESHLALKRDDRPLEPVP